MHASNMTQNAPQFLESGAGTSRAPRVHALDYRISFSILGQQLYVVPLAGDDQRALDRVKTDGQLRSFVLLALKALLLLTFALGVAVILAGGSIAGIYVLKTLAGIDLFEGTSILHDLLT